MSLINDALKRAKQSIQRKSSGAAAPDELGGMPPLQPAYNVSSGGSDSGNVKLAVLALIVIGGIGFKLWPYFHKPTQVKAAAIAPRTAGATKPNATVTAANTATNNNPIARAKRTFDKVHDLHAEGEANYSMVDSKPSPPAAPATAVPAPETASTDRQVVQQPTTAVAQVALPSEPRAKYKLQAIFYRETNPSTLINGKTLGVGDEIDGAKVKTIAPSSVILDYPGGTKELSLR
jgi:hypothetical protein